MPPSKPELRPYKPSSGLPPSYTPQTEFIVPGGERTVGMHVNADGSPRGAGPEYVEVGVDTVRRGTSQEDLKPITPVKDLIRFGTADVKVSPPASAKSGTKIHVDSSYERLRNRIKEDIEEALDRKMDDRLAEFENARTKD